MKKLTELIRKYLVQITITIFFILLVLFIPILRENVPENYPLRILSLRCTILNTLIFPLFFIFKRREYGILSAFPGIGLVSSVAYYFTGNKFFLPLCLSSTITAVISTAFLAFVTIKVKFKD
jgi:hypothetical protein